MEKNINFNNMTDLLEKKVNIDEFRDLMATSNSDKSIEDIKILDYPMDLEKYLNE